MFIGFGTLVNIIAILIGGSLGLFLGERFPQRTQDTVIDCLGLITLMLGGFSLMDLRSPALAEATGDNGPMLIVLGGLIIGGVLGSLLDLESKIENLGVRVRDLLMRKTKGSTDGATHDAAHSRFVKGFVTSSLIFTVGPMAIMGSLNDGLGRGADTLLVKSMLDGFSAIAFAASMGIGVLASVLSVVVVQGLLTLLGVILGSGMPEAELMALSATGGLILIGLGLRLLNVKKVPVSNMLPALLVAPLLVAAVSALR